VEALWTSAARVRDLLLDGADMPSSLASSLSTTTELLEGCIETAVANGINWGTRSVLVAALSHFSELGTELELLRFGRNTDEKPSGQFLDFIVMSH
jgi:hypothetical protein